MSPSRADDRADRGNDDMLRAILEGTAGETGERFFAQLVRNLARALDVRGVWITEYLKQSRRLRAIAFWFDDDWITDYEYAIAGTPCEAVIESHTLVHIPERVVELYPD